MPDDRAATSPTVPDTTPIAALTLATIWARLSPLTRARLIVAFAPSSGLVFPLPLILQQRPGLDENPGRFVFAQFRREVLQAVAGDENEEIVVGHVISR